jgi:hypothetical protein
MTWLGYALIELADWLDSRWLTPPLYRLGSWLS